VRSASSMPRKNRRNFAGTGEALDDCEIGIRDPGSGAEVRQPCFSVRDWRLRRCRRIGCRALDPGPWTLVPTKYRAPDGRSGGFPSVCRQVLWRRDCSSTRAWTIPPRCRLRCRDRRSSGSVRREPLRVLLNWRGRLEEARDAQ
jgi:hypothetical protein